MKQIILLIGIMLALALCITPVAAVSADEFFLVGVVKDEDDNPVSYTYFDAKRLIGSYIDIYATSVWHPYSLVTFKPANIPGAPVMVVDTSRTVVIRLPQSVDVWEIKTYRSDKPLPEPDPMHLKVHDFVNLNEIFGEFIERGLGLELYEGKFICPEGCHWFYYNIHDVS